MVGKVAGKLDKDLLEISTFIILVPYNIINWVHSHTGKIDQRARKKSPSSHQSNIGTSKWRFFNESKCIHNQISYTKVEKVKTKSDTAPISWLVSMFLPRYT